MKLNSKDQKLEAYKRPLAGTFPNQVPDLKNVPDTPKEARVKTFRKNMKTEIEEGQVPCPQVTVPLEVVPEAKEQVPALTEPSVLFEEVSTTVVTTASEAVLASRARTADNAKKNKALQSMATPEPETYGEWWCVVHGGSLPADSSGWVQLQFHAGRAWVPEKKGKVFSSCCQLAPFHTHLEDTVLCPKCVHRNKGLDKSLQV
ncbi:developmental pluripotency-associated protein 4-like [Microtus ochrogaster]|uniref:Developmental pluripotency-associated protein 4-like n=1 Tax=Microtus ochrogaster TaxID=79684 RepID=A0ABM1URH2_MICOH|nr:developmental pluripotency-associated protein 4-like [Microtus ochrogaster]